MIGRPATLSRLASWTLVALGMASLLWRLVDLDQAPFILDEPQFLDAARGQLATGHLLTRSTLVGTSGYYYGGAIFWFYGLAQGLLGPAPLTSLGVMAAAVTAAQAFFAASLSRALCAGQRWGAVLTPEGRWIFGPALLLLGSSPHQHFWSRLAWDQLTNVVAFTVVGLWVTQQGRAWGRAAALGALLGLGLSSHPMLAPFAVIAGVAITVGQERPLRWREALGRLVALSTTAALVLTPWLLELWQQRGQPGNFGAPSPLSLERALEPFRGPGTWGIQYFFDGDWAAFLASPQAPLGWSTLGQGSRWAWVALGLGGLIAGLGGPHRRLALLALATICAYPAFYAWRGIPIQPHYQFPTGWAPVLGGLLLLASPQRWLRSAALGVCLLLAAWQLSFVASWRSWIAARGGTRGVHYAVVLGEQARAVSTLCLHAEGPLVVSLEIAAFPPSFEYLASTTPACAARQVRWCGAGRGCAPPAPEETVGWVRYAESAGARLAVTFSR